MYNITKFTNKKLSNQALTIFKFLLSLSVFSIFVTLALSMFYISLIIVIILIAVIIFTIILKPKNIPLNTISINNINDPNLKIFINRTKLFDDNNTIKIVCLAEYFIRVTSPLVMLQFKNIICTDTSNFESYTRNLTTSLLCIRNENKYAFLLERYLYQFSKLLSKLPNVDFNSVLYSTVSYYNSFIDNEYINVAKYVSSNLTERLQFAQIINNRFFANTPDSAHTILEEFDNHIYHIVDSGFKSIMENAK
jgi:hypothetical protein